MIRVSRGAVPAALRVTATIVLLPLVGMVGCNRAQSQDVGDKPKPPEVFFVLPLVRQITDYEDFNGNTQAIQTVEMRSRVSGYLDKVNFTEGAIVKKNETLAEIDPRTYQAAYDSSVGQMHLAAAVLKEAKADNVRAKGLADTPGAISQQDRDKFQAAEEQAQATLETAKANMKTTGQNLEFTKVIAPFTGRIGRRLVDPGSLVVADTTPITMIVTEDPIYAVFFVDEHTLLRVRRLNEKNKVKSMQDTRPKVQMGLTDELGFPHKGTIDFEDNQVDQQTGTLRLRGVFSNTDRLLSPGLYVRIRLPIGEPHDSLVIPEEALGTDQGRKFLYVVDDKNLAQYRPVTVGSEYGEGMRVVTEGLNAGDRVVVLGLQRVMKPGQPVTPLPQPKKTEPAKAESPKTESPKTEPPKAEPPKTEPAKSESPNLEKPLKAERDSPPPQPKTAAPTDPKPTPAPPADKKGAG